ncbi:MAG TPA: carboxypeptidase-like regulatory domain-containing protein, partial [Thermoanaerobaculia bacterium]|nr:carboxypeptidase-like regulatory domain-containing protein [Thermoanaerobaculia bacterium]
MTRRLPTLLLVASLLAAVAAPAAPTDPSSTAAVAEVSGRVVDSFGRPLAGARAELAPLPSNHAWAAGLLAGRLTPAAVAAANSGPDGRFVLKVPETGVWSLTVTAAGRLAMRLAPLPVVEAEVLPDVALWPSEPVRVRVLDAVGAPAAGVWVHAASSSTAPWDGAEGWRPAARARSTAADGTAVLERGPGEWLEVHALPPGSLTAVAIRGEDRIELRLPPAQPHCTLRVVDADGRALPGVVISRETLAWPSGITAEDGTLRLSAAGVTRGLFLFGPAGERLRSALPEPADAAAADASPPAILVLPGPGTVAGRMVAAETRRPLEGALVAPLYDPGRFVVTSRQGSFALPAAAAPVSELAVHAAGRLPRRVRPAAGDRPVV